MCGEKFLGFMIRKKIVLNRTTFFIFLILLAMTVSIFGHMQFAYAVADFGNPGVLPVGRHQVTFRMGQVSEIQDKFNSSGTLQSPSRMNKRMDNKFLMKQPEFRAFVKMMKEHMLPNVDLEKEADAGAVEFEGNATVDYFAPQIARGITQNWSVGIAIPLVRYQSDIQAYNAGVNTLKTQLPTAVDPAKSGQLNKKMGRQMNSMVDGPKSLMRDKLQGAKFKPVSMRDEQFMGDIVLGSSLRLVDTKRVDFYLLNQLTLPTGPKDDADDMLDLNIFGKTQLQTILFTNYDVSKWLELGVGVSYTWGIEDDIVKRVPRFKGDDIPPYSTRETLDKDPGDAVGAQLYSNVKLTDYYHVGAGYEMSRQQADNYSGSKGSRYDLLEKNTDKTSGIAKFKVTYSAVEGFMRGVEKIPYSVTYAFADHLYGKNVEREMTHELLLKFYF